MASNDQRTIEPFFQQTFEEPEEADVPEKFPAERFNTAPVEQRLLVDVYEDENNLYIRSPLPGIKPEDLDINIDGEILTIQGIHHADLTAVADNFFCQECDWNNFSRSIVLPVPVIGDKISAGLTNGVLTLTVPKANH